ncbi:LacI family DNA-binding transcriptional regulator [Mangrovicoccus sp. HB161399]|uniref:LacI family DNA-binding transcriptional regulator n=1 Tax=Mangrovicoccus sp. HB161399 TaxID=2720392 RepID=UPI001551CC56|nr:LacI family DNA-binding transcriptional regulator [Mangrovicoccus sp. HB161399]
MDETGNPGPEIRLPRRATVKDVARLAGVSAGTVSNALSGKRRVDDATRGRIEAAIAELGYIPNIAARGVRTGRANTIALFSSMPTAVAAGPSKLGFMMEIAASAAMTALNRNVALVLVPPIAGPAEALRNVSFDGALLVEPAEDDPFLALLSSRAIPTVVIGEPPVAAGRHVELHYGATARLLVRHMLETGARAFPLMLGQSRRQSHAAFERVYLEEMAAAGLAPRVIRVDETGGEAAAAGAIRAELAAAPGLDGVLVPVDALATGVMAGLRAAGRRVPQDVRVATRYDGIRARTETPPLTAVDLHLDRVSEIATEALLDLIEGAPPAEIPLPPLPLLVPRASTLATPAEG